MHFQPINTCVFQAVQEPYYKCNWLYFYLIITFELEHAVHWSRYWSTIWKTKWKWNIKIAYYSEPYPATISFCTHSYLPISCLSLLHFSYVYNMIIYYMCYILQVNFHILNSYFNTPFPYMWMHCINLFFLLLHKQKCIQKHYNELILFELLGSSVCKTVEHIQLLNPKMRTWQI